METRKWKIGWKVCRRLLTPLSQPYVSFSHCAHRVDYKIGKIAKRPKGGGPLTVLTTLKAAKYLKSRLYHIHEPDSYYAILKCRWLRSSETRVWLPYNKALAVSIRKLEEKNENILMPGATRLADKVELITEVGGDKK